MSESDVLVVIVNYRTAALTAQCLDSLAAEVASVPGVRAIVADNDSGDGSLALIGKAIESGGYSNWCSLLPLPRNGGFAYGNNEAIRDHLRRSGPPHLVWLLNPDTIVRPGALAEMLQFLAAHPDVAIAGGRCEDPDGTPQHTAFRFHSALSEAEEALQLGVFTRLLRNFMVAPAISEVPLPTDWVSGATMFIRGEVLDRIGLLDEAYFMYFEETDFCLRAARAGYRRWYVPQSRVVHLVGASSEVTGEGRLKPRRPRYWFESRARYYKKNHGRLTRELANLTFLLCYPLGTLGLKLRGKRRFDPPRLWGDFLRYNYLDRTSS